MPTATGHAEDHEATHYWENQPYGPLRPPRTTEPGRRSLSDACAQMATQHLELALRGSPLLNHDRARRAEPRYRPFAPVKLDPDATAKLAATDGFDDLAAIADPERIPHTPRTATT